MVTFDSKFVSGFRNSDCGTGSQSNNKVSSPYGFIIHWVKVFKSNKKVTKVVDVENWRIDNSQVQVMVQQVQNWKHVYASKGEFVQGEVFLSVLVKGERQDLVQSAAHLGKSAADLCTSLIHQMEYDFVLNALDEYLQMGATIGCDSLVAFCTAVMKLYGNEYLRKPTYTDIEKLYAHHEQKHGFHGMIESIDCTDWLWENCQVALKAQFFRRDHEPDLLNLLEEIMVGRDGVLIYILVVVAAEHCWWRSTSILVVRMGFLKVSSAVRPGVDDESDSSVGEGKSRV
ncbi:ALP1-like protein [Tanacetum coccineum]